MANNGTSAERTTETMDELVGRLWESGKRFRYLETHPITFPTAMQRSIAFSLGASRRVMNAGFADVQRLRNYMNDCADQAGLHQLLNEGQLVADGKLN